MNLPYDGHKRQAYDIWPSDHSIDTKWPTGNGVTEINWWPLIMWREG